MKVTPTSALFFIYPPVIAFMVVFGLVWNHGRSTSTHMNPHRHRCELARADANMVLGLMLSPSALDRDSVHGVYDYVLLEQRQCALFTNPIMFDCILGDDGCRAAQLATGNAVMP